MKVYGTITGENDEALPFATIYISGTTIGTTSNLEGKYAFELSEGSYQLVFQYVGYKRITKKIELHNQGMKLNIILKKDVIQLNEVIISSNKEDPAYAIIRAAIRKRKYHQEEVKAYQCQVYIKGLQMLSEKRDKVFGYTVPVDTGIIYLSESISELSVERPNKVKEVMISSKVSGNITNFSYNQGSQMLISFYDNLITINGLSERSFVSPISANALLYYDYVLEGFSNENNLIVNKIKVTPKRKNDPVFEGYIYIIDDTWKIHSVDLTLWKNQIEFFDRMTLHQVYAPVQDSVWMMISQRFNYDLNAFGFKGEGNFVAVHSNYQIELKGKSIISYESSKPITIQKLFPKRYFNNEILSIDDSVNKKDNQYWNSVRPIPLTKIEQADYQKNDSLKLIYESKAYKDSVDNYVNKISLSNILYNGFTYQKSYKGKYIRFDPIIENLQYNTVEGWVIDLSPTYSKWHNEKIKYRLSPYLRYSFSNKKFYTRIRADIYHNPHKSSKSFIDLGHYVSQLNDRSPIRPAVNTFETLLRTNNYMKLYERSFLNIGHQSSIRDGIFVGNMIGYEDRNPLENTSNVSFYGDNEFTDNAPFNVERNDTSFDPYKILYYAFSLKLNFKRKYASRPDGKFLYDSPFPKFEFYYRKAIPVLGASADFEQITGIIKGKIPLGLVGKTQYMLLVGAFLNKNNIQFPDYNHFNSDRSLISRFGIYQMQLLDYYKYSTRARYHVYSLRHHFNGFLVNKIPLLRKSKVQAVASLSYLRTQAVGNYYEYGIGLEHIFKLVRIDYYSSNIDGVFYRQGIRIGLGF